MKWMHQLAGLAVALAATTCLAEMPDWSASRPSAMQMLQPSRLFGGQGWWARYGEPVNATALAQAESSPSDKIAAAPMANYGDGYIYGPGACDCPPPCIGQLWAGYWQNPKRCHPGCHWLHRNGGCDACGSGACGNGCGNGCGLFGHGGLLGLGHGCGTSVSCGCATPVTCSTAVSDCGCKPVCGKCRSCHFGSRFLAHWSSPCSSCSAPIGCGCATPVAPAMAPEKQVLQGPPRPLPEEALLHPLPRLR